MVVGGVRGVTAMMKPRRPDLFTGRRFLLDFLAGWAVEGRENKPGRSLESGRGL